MNSAAQWRAKLSSAARVKAPIALRGLSKFSSETDMPYQIWAVRAGNGYLKERDLPQVFQGCRTTHKPNLSDRD
jgi:hypothetical protein